MFLSENKEERDSDAHAIDVSFVQFIRLVLS